MRIGLDLDGTIITCKSKQCVLMSAIVNAFGLSFSENEFWRDKRKGLNNKLALTNQGFSPNLSDKINSIWITNVEKIEWAGFDKLLEGSMNALSALRAEGHTLHLISARNNIRNAELQLKLLAIEDLFETVDFVRADPKINKAHYFKKRKIDCYIGDTEADFRESKLAGIDFYSVLTGMRSEDFFAHLNLQNQISLDLYQAVQHILATK